LLAAVLTALAWTGCDIPRDNPLDPMNPASSRPAKIMIEAFVNLHTGFPYDEYMVDALDSLTGIYPDVVIAEYHRNTQDFQTPYHRDENEVLYQHYLDALGSNLKGVPDVFINGTESRIQGASDKASAFFRLQQAVLSRAPSVSRFSIEITAAVQAGQVTPQVTLARLGDSGAEGPLLVKAVLVSRIASPRYTRVVSGASKSTEISSLGRGQILKITLPPMQANASVQSELIAYVCDRDETLIYQVEKIRIGQ
jgi:hypothetical protein